jgi:hypothetical protein
MPEAVPLRASLGIKGYLTTILVKMLQIMRWGTTYNIVVDDPGGLVNDFFLKSSSPKQSWLDKV